MRRCSHCADMGHNSRTCPSRSSKLLGVRLVDGTGGGIRKSASMGNLRLWHGHCEGNDHGGEGADGGYASEDFAPGSSSASCNRKKGVSWTEEEHRKFLLGLKKLGKGDWKGISRNFVVSRTPTQVASHAQKYFIRQSNVSRKKRRSSLFDMVADEPAHLLELLPPSSESENREDAPLAEPPCLEEECESMDSTNPWEPEVILPSSSASYPVVAFPPCLPVPSPFPFPLLPSYHGAVVLPVKETHEVIKPMPVHLKAPMDVDHLLGISKLSLGESIGEQMLDLSLKLNSASSYRQSAFHANLSTSSSSVRSNFSPVSAL